MKVKTYLILGNAVIVQKAGEERDVVESNSRV